LKVWADHSDPVLHRLCSGMVDRNLYKIRLQKEESDPALLHSFRQKAKAKYNLADADISYFVFTGSISNSAYDPSGEQIKVAYRDGGMMELSSASDQLDVAILSSPVRRHFLCVLPELLD
jgi:Tfp pilus assembly protein PilW